MSSGPACSTSSATNDATADRSTSGVSEGVAQTAFGRDSTTAVPLSLLAPTRRTSDTNSASDTGSPTSLPNPSSASSICATFAERPMIDPPSAESDSSAFTRSPRFTNPVPCTSALSNRAAACCASPSNVLSTTGFSLTDDRICASGKSLGVDNNLPADRWGRFVTDDARAARGARLPGADGTRAVRGARASRGARDPVPAPTRMPFNGASNDINFGSGCRSESSIAPMGFNASNASTPTSATEELDTRGGSSTTLSNHASHAEPSNGWRKCVAAASWYSFAGVVSSGPACSTSPATNDATADSSTSGASEGVAQTIFGGASTTVVPFPSP